MMEKVVALPVSVSAVKGDHAIFIWNPLDSWECKKQKRKTTIKTNLTVSTQKNLTVAIFPPKVNHCTTPPISTATMHQILHTTSQVSKLFDLSSLKCNCCSTYCINSTVMGENTAGKYKSKVNLQDAKKSLCIPG